MEYWNLRKILMNYHQFWFLLQRIYMIVSIGKTILLQFITIKFLNKVIFLFSFQNQVVV